MVKNKLSNLAWLAHELIHLPTADLVVCPTVHYDAPGAYQYFTKRHPKYKVIQSKAWGAALIDLSQFAAPEQYMESIKGHNKGAYFANKAKKRGYVVREINRNEHIDDIHAINTSLDTRQGRPMDQAYVAKRTHYQDEPNYRYFGVFNPEGQLLAYCDVGFYGNFALANRLLGYRSNDGAMHFMLTEIVKLMIREKKLAYLMYATFFGASPGLRTFKTILGFKPYRARYAIKPLNVPGMASAAPAKSLGLRRPIRWASLVGLGLAYSAYLLSEGV